MKKYFEIRKNYKARNVLCIGAAILVLILAWASGMEFKRGPALAAYILAQILFPLFGWTCPLYDTIEDVDKE